MTMGIIRYLRVRWGSFKDTKKDSQRVGLFRPGLCRIGQARERRVG